MRGKNFVQGPSYIDPPLYVNFFWSIYKSFYCLELNNAFGNHRAFALEKPKRKYTYISIKCKTQKGPFLFFSYSWTVIKLYKCLNTKVVYR